ncbi:MAG: TetR/AcrR family transcriptional regulator [Mycobacterium leprae]
MRIGERKRAEWTEASERKRQICDAAITVFANRSYGTATTTEVAQQAGVSQATVFKYFATKRELFLAVLSLTTDLVEERWQADADGQASPLAGLRAIARTYAMMAATQQDAFRVRIRAVAESDDPEIQAAARSSYERLVCFVQGLVEAARAQGELPATVDPRAAAWYFLSVGQGFNLNHFVGFGWDETTLETIIADLFRGMGVN